MAKAKRKNRKSSALIAPKAELAVAPQESVLELSAKIQHQREQIGSPTLFINRFFLQGYPDGGIRFTLGEQYSGDLTVPPVSRAAFYMHTPTAIAFAQQLVDSLPPGSITLPNKESD